MGCSLSFTEKKQKFKRLSDLPKFTQQVRLLFIPQVDKDQSHGMDSIVIESGRCHMPVFNWLISICQDKLPGGIYRPKDHQITVNKVLN